jgi:hypothetical protein
VLTVQSVRMLTWQAVRHGAGRTTHGRAIQHDRCWLVGLWMNEHWTRGILVANSMVTRGLHVSPGQWFKGFAIGRTQPCDLQAGEETWEGPPNQCATVCSLLYECNFNYLNLQLF